MTAEEVRKGGGGQKHQTPYGQEARHLTAGSRLQKIIIKLEDVTLHEGRCKGQFHEHYCSCLHWTSAD